MTSPMGRNVHPNFITPLSSSGPPLIVQLACISLDKILVMLLVITKPGGGGILLFNSPSLVLYLALMIMNE